MNRRLAFTMVGLMAGSVLLPFSATADGGLTIWVFAGPDTVGLGDDLTVNVEAYLYDQPVDLDTLDVSAGFSSAVVNMTHTGTGKYHGTYSVGSDDVSYGFLSVAASGDAGGLSAGDTQFLFLDSGGVASGWDMTVRLGNFGEMPLGVGPGTVVTVEARTYLDGALAEGGVVNMTIVTAGYGGGGQNTSHVAMTKVSNGVYQHTIQVPASLGATQSYGLNMELGPAGDMASSTLSFTAQPFRVLAFPSNVTSTSANVHIIAGLDAPLSGATVSITGSKVTMVPPYVVTVGPFTGTTGSDGQVTVRVNWSGEAPSTFDAIVTAGGKTVGFPFVLGGMGGPGWEPTAPSPYGCDVTLQTDPSDAAPGTTAHLTFKATFDGDPIATTEVTTFTGTDGEMAWASVANKTTDGSGDFAVDFAVPALWNYFEDMMAIAIVCPSGDFASATEHLGSPGEMYSTGDVTVTAAGTAAAGGDLAVTVAYTGPKPAAGAYGFAMLVPGSDPAAFFSAIAAGTVGANLSSTGATTFAGTVHVPAALPAGNYTLFVYLTNMGATSNRADEFAQGGLRAVTVTAGTGGTGNNGTGNNGTGGNGQNQTNDQPTAGSPGFEGVAAVAAIALVLGVAAGGRRRRGA